MAKRRLAVGLGNASHLQELKLVSLAPLPAQVSGLPLSSQILGRPALRELFRMHGQDFSLNKAVVGIYGRENEIIIYVAGAPLKFLAGELLKAMRDKIAENNSPFQLLAIREIDQHTLFELKGMGQRHYYFRSGDLIIWLTAADTWAEQALEEVLVYYP